MSLAEIKCFFIYHFQTRRKSSFTCITSVWSPKFVYNTVFVVVSSLSCVWLFATPWTAACQAPLSIGFPRQELEWVALSFSRGSSWPKGQSQVSCIDKQILYCWATREALNKCHLLLLLWPYYDQISLGKLISRVKCPKEHELGLLYQIPLCDRELCTHFDPIKALERRGGVLWWAWWILPGLALQCSHANWKEKN